MKKREEVEGAEEEGKGEKKGRNTATSLQNSHSTDTKCTKAKKPY